MTADDAGMRERLTGQTPDTSSMRSDVKEVALVTSPVSCSSGDTATTCDKSNRFESVQNENAVDSDSGAHASTGC